MTKRQEAMKWWNNLSSAYKAQICDTNVELIGSIRRWETLTGREIEMLFDDECKSDAEIIEMAFPSIAAVADLEHKTLNIERMNNKQQKVETSTESAIVVNTVLAVRCYQIDFGNHLRCKIKVTDNRIEVECAINGWGDGVPLSEVVVVELQ